MIKMFKGRQIVSDYYIRKKYKITQKEIFKLIHEGKIHSIADVTRLFFNAKAVRKYFADLKFAQDAPITISAQDLIAKYGLDRIEFMELRRDNKLKPLPLPDEPNEHFGFKEVEQFFQTYIKN
jgi:hypothetical protein